MRWQPSATLEALRARAAMIQRIRTFFDVRNVLEVEVPCLDIFPNTDPNMATIEVICGGVTQYLQTSPEYAMKRLLARDGVDIYSIAKAFRDDDLGPRHNPEFTMLEWYRVGMDWQALMHEVADLCHVCAEGLQSLSPPLFDSYGALFERHLGLDPHKASLMALRHACDRFTDLGSLELSRVECLDLLFSYGIEPTLGAAGLQFVYDYPACMSALAVVEKNASNIAVTRRFELFFRGIELANGYQELTDSEEQARRFASDEDQRRMLNKSAYRGDPRLISALQHGVPGCAGVALGVDRLLMTLLNEKSLSAVQAFPQSRDQ